MPYINVDEAYILDNTGLQVDNSVDYANANSNRNLLDNPWFGSGEVVNQRGVTSGQTTHDAYTVDRWFTSYGNALGTWSIGANGLTLSAASATYCLMQQNIPTSLATQLTGKTVTCSYLTASGEIRSGTIQSLDWSTNPIVFTYGVTRIQLMSNYGFRITARDGGTSETIRAVKLELGSYSTLINDTPPNYAEELAKCQYYYREIECISADYSCIGYAVAASAFRVTLPYTMRDRPSVSFSGTITAYYSGGNSAISAIAPTGKFDNVVTLAFTTSGSGLTAGTSVGVYMATGAKIMLSADL